MFFVCGVSHPTLCSLTRWVVATGQTVRRDPTVRIMGYVHATANYHLVCHACLLRKGWIEGKIIHSKLPRLPIYIGIKTIQDDFLEVGGILCATPGGETYWWSHLLSALLDEIGQMWCET